MENILSAQQIELHIADKYDDRLSKLEEKVSTLSRRFSSLEHNVNLFADQLIELSSKLEVRHSILSVKLDKMYMTVDTVNQWMAKFNGFWDIAKLIRNGVYCLGRFLMFLIKVAAVVWVATKIADSKELIQYIIGFL